jgi:hypothetical protein
MVFKNTDMRTLLKDAEAKTLVCFGAGRQLRTACEEYSSVSFFDRIGLIADNDENKSCFSFMGKDKPVRSISECLKLAEKEPVIIITMANFVEIVEQLNAIHQLDNNDLYIFGLIREFVGKYELTQGRALREKIKIPKAIHYCWFGGAPIREDFAGYITGWKKLCPDYDIVRWDESNYDVKKNEYMYEAYKNKKWGFVSDYARLDIVYRHGGVYLDTDVELVRNIDDLLCDEAFYGFEGRLYVNNGSGFGAVAGSSMIAEQMEIYRKLSFVNEDGALNLIPAPIHQTKLLVSKGLKQDNTLQKIEGMTVYPSDVLSPLSHETGVVSSTKNTYAVHHYSSTWFDVDMHDARRKKHQMYEKFMANLK